MPEATQLKQHLANQNILSLSSNSDLHQLADEIKTWFNTHAQALPSLEQIDLLHDFTYKQNFVFEGWTHKDKLRWLITLIGQLVSCPPLDVRAWPPPIQFRVKGLFDGIDRLGDYVLLYEAFIHFHFVVVASQFVWMIRDLAKADLLPTVTFGQKIVLAALTDRKCMGGRVWLHRAGGISRVAYELLSQATELPYPPLAELFHLLEPEQIELHPVFKNVPQKDGIVKTGGCTFRLFELLQQVRNTLMAHDEEINSEVEGPIADGLGAMFGAVGQKFAPYQRLGLAVTDIAEGQLVLNALWDIDGNLRQPQNNAVRRNFFVPLWGQPQEPQAPFPAPEPPLIEGWYWEDSLMLFDRSAPRARYLYLMPLGYRYTHRDGEAKLLPGLLESVIWSKNAATRRNSLTLIQRKYLDRQELSENWHDDQGHQPPQICQASENVQTLVGNIRANYQLDFELPEEDTEVVPRVFDLRHGPQAIRRAKNTVPRTGEVNRIFGRARELIASNPEGCVLLLIIGPSGIGKSVLLAQMYSLVSNRALYLTMDNPPEPEYEAIPASQNRTLSVGAFGDDRLPQSEPQSLPFDGDRRERSLGVPVRMHWLAGAKHLAKKPAPMSLLETEETQRQIAALLKEAAAGSDPLFIFIDAINQALVPESLLQGFKPFSRLPPNVVLIASTQDNETVLARLTDNNRQPWEKIHVEALAQEQTREVFLQSLKTGSLPTLSDEFIGFLHEKSQGLPLLVHYWGEQFADFWRDIPATAEHRLRAALSRPDSTLLPRTYFNRLIQASEEFVPKKLPEALLWCLSLVTKPLGIEQLTQAIACIRPLIRPLIGDLPAVSKADIDAAISQLSGYLQAESAGFENIWRLAHPLIGEAWLDYFGKPGCIAAINEALLPFGAMPRIETWDKDRQRTWLERLCSGATEYKRLEKEQKRVLADRLLSQLSNHEVEEMTNRISSTPSPDLEINNRLINRLITLKEETRKQLAIFGEWSPREAGDLANAYLRRGNMRRTSNDLSGALADYGRSIALMDALRTRLEPTGDWPPQWANDLAAAHLNRGNARYAGNDLSGALGDYDRSIVLMDALRTRLEPTGDWLPHWANDLAGAYINRGNAYRDVGDLTGTLVNYDLAMAVLDALRTRLGDTGNWPPAWWANNLAATYMNRGVTRRDGGQFEEALQDFERAISLLEGSQPRLEATSEELLALNDLAAAYMNRGAMRGTSGDLGAALQDYDRAIGLRESLRGRLEKTGEWLPALTNTLAVTYSNRGKMRQASGILEEGLRDFDQAIELREGLRQRTEETGQWSPDWTNDLAAAYLDRVEIRRAVEDMDGVLQDFDQAIELKEDLRQRLEPTGEWPPAWTANLAAERMNRGNERYSTGLLEGAIEDWNFVAEHLKPQVDEEDLEKGTDLLKVILLIIRANKDLADWPAMARSVLEFKARHRQLEASWIEQQGDMEPPWKSIESQFTGAMRILNLEQRIAWLRAMGECDGLRIAAGASLAGIPMEKIQARQ